MLPVLLAAAALAADPAPAKAPPVVGVTLMTVSAKEDGVVMDRTEYKQETVTVPYTYVQDGKQVTGTRNETRVVPVMTRSVVKFKDMKATGTDGKAMPADAVEKSLKDGGVVVSHFGPLDVSFRKAFKDGTVFLEQTPPAVPVVVMPAVDPKKEDPKKESK